MCDNFHSVSFCLMSLSFVRSLLNGLRGEGVPVYYSNWICKLSNKGLEPYWLTEKESSKKRNLEFELYSDRKYGKYFAKTIFRYLKSSSTVRYISRIRNKDGIKNQNNHLTSAKYSILVLCPRNINISVLICHLLSNAM